MEIKNLRQEGTVTKVIGEFTAVVPEPIATAPGILNLLNQHRAPDPLKLSFSESEVLVYLGEQTDPIFNEHGEVDQLPMIKSFIVWITRDVSLQSDSIGRETLSIDDERDFEGILVEAVKRVVSAIKQRTRQSFIDTRHPIHSYSYKYHMADQTVDTVFPLRSGSHRMPQYTLGRISFGFLHSEELDETKWKAIQTGVSSPVELPLYDELIHDAETLRFDMRYQLAALSAAIAVELMLGEICSTLLRREGNLQNTQIQAILSDRRTTSLVRLIKALSPSVQIDNKEIQSIFEERNRIAHGESRYTDPDRMAEMIKVSYKVRKVLTDLINT